MVAVYKKTGLEVEYLDYYYGYSDMVFFGAREIVVDGIASTACDMNYRSTVTRNPIISPKEDYLPSEDRAQRRDGYMHSEHANWDSPYKPVLYVDGDIDDEVFVLTGLIVGKGSFDYPDARALADKLKELKKTESR